VEYGVYSVPLPSIDLLGTLLSGLSIGSMVTAYIPGAQMLSVTLGAGPCLANIFQWLDEGHLSLDCQTFEIAFKSSGSCLALIPGAILQSFGTAETVLDTIRELVGMECPE
jgi:hypothetical protein